MPDLVYTLRLSDVAAPFVAASLDLLQVVLDADECSVTDEIHEAAEQLLAVVEGNRGNL
jgi:hypothetical protein